MLLCSDKDNIIDKILKSYEVYYDVEKCENKSLPLVATCINTTENKIYSNKSGKVTSDFLEELFYKKNSRFKKLKKQYN